MSRLLTGPEVLAIAVVASMIALAGVLLWDYLTPKESK